MQVIIKQYNLNKEYNMKKKIGLYMMEMEQKAAQMVLGYLQMISMN